MLTKLRPRSLPGLGGASWLGEVRPANRRLGRAIASTLSSDRTSADRLRERRNERREEDKSVVPFLDEAVLEFAPTLLRILHCWQVRGQHHEPAGVTDLR